MGSSRHRGGLRPRRGGRYPRPPKGPTPFRKRVERLLLLLLLGFFTYILFIGEDYGLYHILTQQRTKSKLEAQIERLRQERGELEIEKQRLTGDLSYIERKAREEYGMVKRGEWIYRVIIEEH